MSDAGLPQLSPLQNTTLALLRRSPDALVFDPAFVESLRTHVAESVAELAERVGDGQVFISKHRLSSVLGCEALHLHDDKFAWNPAIAGGQIAHRAIQLLLNWRGQPVPADLVDEAIARVVEEDTSLGDWAAGLADADLADLRGNATDRVIKFLECFPPLDRRARPTTESTVRWPNDGAIVLSGKVDLVIGRPAGAESRKVLIDLKTGRPSRRHSEDLRFYALVETMRTHVPPRKLVSFYLDSGTPVVEDVTENVLNVAVRRALDAINAEIELRIEGRAPVKRPGTPCKWCPLLNGCAEGQAYLAGDDDTS